MSTTSRSYGRTEEGNEIYIFTLVNGTGMKAEITNYGGILTRLYVHDKNGILDDVVLGYEGLDSYFKGHQYFGAIIGRNANRLKNAKFELGSDEYKLYKNDGNNHLHGGLKGFDKKVWAVRTIENENTESLQLTYRSKDGEEGYPGNLDVDVIYTLTEDNALKIEYYAQTDKDTIVNLTNHSYFNLSGHNRGDISKHELMINGDKFTANDSECLTTGEIRDVKGTPMDFTALTSMEMGLLSDYDQIISGRGYDHNWILNVSGKEPEKGAEAFDPQSGRVLEVYTTKPGLQLYSGNFLDGTDVGKDGSVYNKRSGFCLETQFYPNAMVHKHFPSPILKAGQKYYHTTIYKFLTRDS